MKLYTFVFKDSLKILWKYKFLFLPGILLSFLGNGGEYEILIRNLTILKQSFNKELFLKILNLNGIFSFQFVEIFLKYLKLLLNLKFLSSPITFGVLSAILLLFSLYIQAALIYFIAQKYQGKNISFKKSLIKTKKKFKEIILIHLLFFIFTLTIFSTIGFPILLIFSFGLNLDFTLILKTLIILVLTPLLIMSSFLTKFSICYLIIYDLGFTKSIIYALELFKKNLLISLELAFFLFILSFILGISDILLISLLLYPFIISLTFIKSAIPLQKFYFIHFLSTSIIFFLFISPFLSIFQHIAWTILFLKISKQGYKSKILRIFQGIYM